MDENEARDLSSNYLAIALYKALGEGSTVTVDDAMCEEFERKDLMLAFLHRGTEVEIRILTRTDMALLEKTMGKPEGSA